MIVVSQNNQQLGGTPCTLHVPASLNRHYLSYVFSSWRLRRRLPIDLSLKKVYKVVIYKTGIRLVTNK